ncbi:hypothetical protein AGMMS49991_09240 [Spirochaetia bacterium]|nr:hypothetical protein AGMMS49991_09240 [Spirochaetia bacterium]
MKKIIAGLVIMQFLLLSCSPDINENEDPEYTANIAWVSNTDTGGYTICMIDGDSIYAYVYKGVTYADDELVRINAQTGEILWRTPMIIGDYIYLFWVRSVIFCYNKQTGDFAARVRVDINNQSLASINRHIGYGKYLYFGIGDHGTNTYFVRLDVDAINKDGNTVEQIIEPEILWRPYTDRSVWTTPVINNNVVYVNTFVGNASDAPGVEPIELVGINIDTGEIVFTKRFGIAGGVYYDQGATPNALFAHDDVLYYIGRSISAWDLKTGEQKYLKTFTYDTPPKQNYAADDHVEVTYWNGKLYYTTSRSTNIGGSSGYKNIYCIDAKTGNLVWSDMPPRSESLRTNPIIAHNRMYVPHGYGMRVYNPETGKVIGVDKKFYGTALGHNILYGDYMITTRYDGIRTPEARISAVYVGE